MRLLIAPHNDDECLFAAFTIMRHKPLVIILTDGWRHEVRGVATVKQRRQESAAAMKLLGAQLIFAGIRDDQLTAEAMMKVLADIDTGHVYAPAVHYDGNPEHNLVGTVADKLWPGKVIHYVTYIKSDLAPTGTIEILPTPEEAALKERAMACYVSQLKCNRPHFDAVRGKPEYYV